MSVTLNRKQALTIFGKTQATVEEGSKHIKIYLEIGGKQVFRTLLSRSSGDSIPTGTAHKILRDIGVANNRPLAMGMRDCTKGTEDYFAHLEMSGLLNHG
jgi:hypothetical protein